MPTQSESDDIKLAEDLASLPAFRRENMAENLGDSLDALRKLASRLELEDIDSPNGPHGELINEHLALCEIIHQLKSTRLYKILIPQEPTE